MDLRAFFIKKASDFSPMPCYSIRLLCVLLHLYCEPRSEVEGVFEDGASARLTYSSQQSWNFFKDLLLLVGEGFLQILVVARHIAKKFFHFL